jgi:valyl-tRNA synthetase
VKEIPKTFEPKKYEEEIYKTWEESGFFNPDNLDLPEDAKPYTIVLPPPNITDKLHLGHASMLAIEDLLIRFHRMRGYRALWVPGTDHAAIATQNVVEKKLLKERNITRHDLGREKFLEEVWKFLRITQATILNQTRHMGASMDWSREAFTFDEERKGAVARQFVDMYNEGLIYQGERIVNWCPRCHSTLADDEVEHEEQKGKLYTFKYSNDFPFSIATTRPETKLGDTAVAVNPKDKRFKEYIGKTFEVDFCGVPLKLKIIANRGVEMDFGTGALGVTPAHSMVDWQMAEENGLEIKKVIDEDAKILPGFGNFSGLSVLEARKEVVETLRENGLMEKEEDVENNISTCYRCGTVIEPIPSKQWFMAVDKKLDRLGGKSLKERALEVANNKEIRFIPYRFTKRYTDWMTNLHDWCISRQIWFGHEIPVWYKEGSKDVENPEIYVGEKAPSGEGWVQDPDTLDTWFSSGMWTFSTLGWPDNFKDGKKSGDLKKFHPTQMLETGYEIITLWVSRMIMMSLFAIGEIPFENVYLHGLVLDKFGKKMSKSKGNGIDPIDMINLFGTDAVRLALLIGSTPGNDMRISEEKIASFRNFVTKLWNIYRYAIQADPDFKLVEKLDEDDIRTNSDKWIVSQLNKVIKETTSNLSEYKFSLAGENLEKFSWDEFASWYLEINKVEKNYKVLGYVLDKILKLWHPFAPFVTEKIYGDLSGGEKMLMVESWPVANEKFIDEKAEKTFREMQGMISKIRNIRSSYHIDPARVIKSYAEKIGDKEVFEKLSRLEIVEGKGSGLEIVGKNIKLTLDISELVDIAKEKDRIQKEISNLENLIIRTKNLLGNKGFVDSAPREVIEQNESKLGEYEEKAEIQRELLENLSRL